MLGKTLILGGGSIDSAFAAEYIHGYSFDTIACADSGLDTAYALSLPVDYIMGDFDSVAPEVLSYFQNLDEDKRPEFVSYPPEKDDTDMQLVLEFVLENAPSEVVILGATGKRLDHFLANIQILMLGLRRGIPVSLVDANNRICLMDSVWEQSRANAFGKYISFLPFTNEVKGITLSGFKYPLREAKMTQGNSLGVSNEFAKDVTTVKASVREGILIVIESKD